MREAHARRLEAHPLDSPRRKAFGAQDEAEANEPGPRSPSGTQGCPIRQCWSGASPWRVERNSIPKKFMKFDNRGASPNIERTGRSTVIT